MSPSDSRLPRRMRRALRLPSTKARLDREVDDEVRFHLETRAAELRARGVSADDAWTEAVRRFGDADDLREYCQSIEVPKMRRAHARDWLESCIHDLQFAVRQFKRAPAFVAVTALTLGLGIGAATAIFTVVDNVLLRPLPYPESERIVEISELSARGNANMVGDPTFDDWVAQNRSVSALATFRPPAEVSALVGDRPLRAQLALVSGRFFEILRIRPLRGRAFSSDESREGGPPAVLLGEAFWRRELSADPSVVGTALSLSGRSYMIVGIMPAVADFPAGTDLWAAAEAATYHHTSRTAHNWFVLGRLAPGVSLEQARVDMSTITKRLKRQLGNLTDASDAAVVPLREEMVGHTRAPLLLLLGASGVLLLIACANVVNLLIARIAARRAELAVRVALGAARARVVQQCLVEALLLSLAGAVIGVLLARAGVKLLLLLRPPSLPRLDDIHFDTGVLVFAIAVSVGIAIALGLLTAWYGTQGDVRDALSQTQRTQAGSASSAGLRRLLVVAQMAMTVVLLVGSALLGRSFVRVLQVDPGFRPSRSVILDLAIPAREGDTAARSRRQQQFDEILTRLRGLPGVTRVGGSTGIPFGIRGSNGGFVIRDRRVATAARANIDEQRRMFQTPGAHGNAEFRLVTPGYFEAMHIPLLRGRLPNEQDTPAMEHVAVISEALAAATWPNENAIGKYIDYANMDDDVRTFTVVGIVGDVRESLETEPRGTFYGLFAQRPNSGGLLNIVIETTGDPSAVIAAGRRIVHDVRPDVPPQFRTMDAMIARSIAGRRFTLVLIGVFGATALLLATLGVYSVVAYLVTQRARELSIRVAVGARSRDIVRLVLGQGLGLALAGIAVGVAASVALTRLIRAMLFGVGATDPIAFAGVAVALSAAAALASYFPARRAARLDAMNVLRGG